jgi:hypothetical protein
MIVQPSYRDAEIGRGPLREGILVVGQGADAGPDVFVRCAEYPFLSA